MNSRTSKRVAVDASTMTNSDKPPPLASAVSTLHAFSSLYSINEKNNSTVTRKHSPRANANANANSEDQADEEEDEGDASEFENEDDEQQLIRHRFPPLTEEQRQILANDTFPYPPPSHSSSHSAPIGTAAEELSLSTFAWLSAILFLCCLCFSSLFLFGDYVYFSLSPDPLSFRNSACFALHSFLSSQLTFSIYFSILSLICLLISAFTSSVFTSHPQTVLTAAMLFVVAPSIALLALAMPIAMLLRSEGSINFCPEMPILPIFVVVAVTMDGMAAAAVVAVIGVLAANRAPLAIDGLKRCCKQTNSNTRATLAEVGMEMEMEKEIEMEKPATQAA